jgi:signal transduction histidine kinase
MRREFISKHPFRLLLILEWILLGIALVALLAPLVFPNIEPRSPGPMPPPPGFHDAPRSGSGFHLESLVCLGFLGFLGLRLPVGNAWLQAGYILLSFGLSWLTVLTGGRGESILPSLLLVVVIRGCLLFPWAGRLLVTAIAYGSFLAMQFMALYQVRPLGVPISRPLLPGVGRRFDPELIETVFWRVTLNSALLFALVLAFVLLLVGALLAEKQSREALRTANQKLRQYALLIEDQATLQERNRIAREIHDSLGHALTAQSIQLENVAMHLTENPDQASGHLQKARQLGKDALQNVRQSVASLRHHPLKGKSLEVAIAQLVQEFESNTGIPVTTEWPAQIRWPGEMAIALYRVIQEALTNVARHSDADAVQLTIHQDNDIIQVTLQDNGKGFDPRENTTGFGLQSMQERVLALGGDFSLTSQPDAGCRIQITIPFVGGTP